MCGGGEAISTGPDRCEPYETKPAAKGCESVQKAADGAKLEEVTTWRRRVDLS